MKLKTYQHPTYIAYNAENGSIRDFMITHTTERSRTQSNWSDPMYAHRAHTKHTKHTSYNIQYTCACTRTVLYCVVLYCIEAYAEFMFRYTFLMEILNLILLVASPYDFAKLAGLYKLIDIIINMISGGRVSCC